MEVTIDFSKIRDRDSFHSIFQTSMGFPNFYGNNMDAWIDCMSYIDEPKAGMSSVTVLPGESLDMVLVGTEAAVHNCPEVFLDFLECTAFVNQRFIEAESGTRLRLTAT